jgi:hypothetical protein
MNIPQTGKQNQWGYVYVIVVATEFQLTRQRC